MRVTNKFNLPKALVDLVDSETKVFNNKRFSVTELLKPTREILLRRRHDEDLEKDISDCVNLLFGTAFHSLIEKHDKTGMAELKLEENIFDDYILVGKLDLYDQENETIIDYKTGTVWKILKNDFADWRFQGLAYAWLCFKKGYLVKKIKFYAFLKDWTAKEKRTARLRNEYYPETSIYIYEYEIKLSDIMKIEKRLIDKFKDLASQSELLDDELEVCSNSDCWYTGDKYAVYKNVATDVRAQRVFDTKEEADNYLQNKLNNKGIILFRKGEYRKCQDYCEVCNFCKYYKERGGK